MAEKLAKELWQINHRFFTAKVFYNAVVSYVRTQACSNSLVCGINIAS